MIGKVGDEMHNIIDIESLTKQFDKLAAANQISFTSLTLKW
ncbi:hypothetical protein [Muricomes intestini]